MSERAPQPDTYYALPEQVHNELWARIEARLSSGEVLITTEQFKQALEEEYLGITGEAPSDDLKNLFNHAVDSFNEENPDAYLLQGVQNGVIEAFRSGVERLEWNAERIESRGPNIIDNFKGRETIRNFLSSLRVAPERIDARSCVRSVIKDIKSRVEEPQEAPPAPANSVTLSADAANALQDGDIDRRQVDERIAAETQVHRRIERREIQRVPRRVYKFVDQGLLSQEEVGQIVELHSIDQQVARGEMSSEDGGRARARLMDRKTRARLNDKLKGAVDYSVRYLQVFEALKRIPVDYDGALRFLIRHKGLCGPQADRQMLGLALRELVDDEGLLEAVSDLMDRRDQEIRMISVSLPPYSHVARQGREPISKMLIEEEFVDELRQVSADEMSERLNEPEGDKRGRNAAAIQCLIALINYVLKPTPLRKEIRLLKIQHVLEEFFYESNDLGAARSQAVDLIKRRLRNMYPDFSVDERTALQQRTQTMLDGAEEKVAVERGAGAEQQTGSPTRALAEDDAALSSEEEARGAVLGRVQFRIPGGGVRNVRHRIMPDPDDAELMIIVHRDPDSGDLAPLRRNGAKRYVKQERNGLWKTVTGG
jgi:hypothetical protein